MNSLSDEPSNPSPAAAPVANGESTSVATTAVAQPTQVRCIAWGYWPFCPTTVVGIGSINDSGGFCQIICDWHYLGGMSEQ